MDFQSAKTWGDVIPHGNGIFNLWLMGRLITNRKGPEVAIAVGINNTGERHLKVCKESGAFNEVYAEIIITDHVNATACELKKKTRHRIARRHGSSTFDNYDPLFSYYFFFCGSSCKRQKMEEGTLASLLFSCSWLIL